MKIKTDLLDIKIEIPQGSILGSINFQYLHERSC